MSIVKDPEKLRGFVNGLFTEKPKKKSIFFKPNFLDTMSEAQRRDYFKALAKDVENMSADEFWAFIDRNSIISKERGIRNGRN